MTYIYALIDPTTEEPYYVGKTANPTAREESHLQTAPRVSTLGIQSTGKAPLFVILKRYSFDTDLSMMEAAWINRFIDQGYMLDNVQITNFRFVQDGDDYRVYLDIINGTRREFAGKPFVEPPPLPEGDPFSEFMNMSPAETKSLFERRPHRRRPRTVTEEDKRAVTKVFDVPI